MNKVFKVYWLSGNTGYITGKNIVQAVNRFGYTFQAVQSWEVL